MFNCKLNVRHLFQGTVAGTTSIKIQQLLQEWVMLDKMPLGNRISKVIFKGIIIIKINKSQNTCFSCHNDFIWEIILCQKKNDNALFTNNPSWKHDIFPFINRAGLAWATAKKSALLYCVKGLWPLTPALPRWVAKGRATCDGNASKLTTRYWTTNPFLW